jgi:hypothetical protein
VAQAADTQMAWEQVRAWQRTYELLDAQQKQLQASRDELTAAWPPGRSTAAQSFAAYLDGVLQNIADAKLSAIANRSALASVLLSLSATKAELAPVKAEWDRHEAERHDPAIQMTRGGGFAAQQALNAQARRLMEANDQEAREATNQMVVPVPLQPVVDDSEVVVASTDHGSAEGATGSQGPRGTSWSRVPVIPSPAEIDEGVGLAGGSSPSQPVQLGPSGIPSPMTPVLVAQPPFTVTTVGGGPPGPGARGITAASGRIAARGGVIGGTAAGAGPAQGASTRGRGVSPVGGVIGQQNPTHVSGMPLAGGAGRRADNRPAASEHEPTMVWTVKTGLAPVVQPPVERPHELGPGVIGVDR